MVSRYGVGAGRLAPAGAVIGIDPNKAMLAVARRKAWWRGGIAERGIGGSERKQPQE